MSQRALLEGVRVLDFTTAWAGPFVGRYLGALGADVVKVESASRIDLWRAPVNVRGESYNQAPNFNALNRNKRSLSLDVATEGGREVFLQLVARADVMIANYTARVLPNLRLTYEDLRAVNPTIILLNMPALGATGPYRALAGYGTIIEGFGGLAARFGYRHEGARVSQTFYPDAVAGVHGLVSILAALYRRKRTSQGCEIDFSQQEALLLQLAEGIALHSLTGRNPARMGNAEPRRAPSGIYPTAYDRGLAIVVKTDEQFQSLLDTASVPWLERFRGLSLSLRLAQRQAIDDAVSRWTLQEQAGALQGRMRLAGIPSAAVNDYARAQRSPEFSRLSIIEDVTHPETGVRPYLRTPVSFDGFPLRTRSPAPLFGADSDAVLSEWLGMGTEAVEALRESGVVGDVPIVR